MQTYAKQVQQVKSAVAELQVQFGKAFLPIAKTGLQAVRFLIESFTNIPPVVKGAIASFSALFVLMTKGSGLVESFVNKFVGGKAVFGDFFSSLQNEFKKGVFEVTGREMGGVETRGLKTFMDVKSSRDMESFLGKMVFMSAKAGRAWNSFLADIAKGTSSASVGVAKSLDFISDRLFNLGTYAAGKGGPAGAIVGALSGVLGTAADLGELGFDKVGKMFGFTAQQMALLTRESTGVIGALGPMIGSFFALKPLLGTAYDGFRRLTVSAGDYEKSIDGIRRKTSGELSDIRNLGQQYDSLQRSVDRINEARKPEVKKRAVEREEYADPLQELGKVYSDTTDFANRLADVNISLVSSFDKFGNAVLKSTDNLQSFVDTLSSAKIAEILGTELDVLGKYVEDLTKTTGMETFKKEFKILLNEIPVIGSILAKSIKVAPAKELETITNKMNKLLGLRAKFPLTTAFDVDIESYKKKLSEARSEYRKTYDDFRRVLADLPTEGLAPAQITEALTRPEFKKGFETIVAFEPKLQTKRLKGKVTAEDILGTEVLKKIHPDVPLDFTAALTKGLLMQRNAIRREGEAFAGDVVLFTGDVADKYDIAGNQAILKMQKTTDGMVKWTAEYFDKEMGVVAEVPFEKVDKYVESIFPARAMQERLQGNIEVLQEFVAGAEAGLRGIGQKDFKREFNLGSRFFGGVPTTTLVQSTKGYEPSKGFGEVPFKQNWDKWIQDNFVKPMTEYRLILEQVSKMQLETGEALMAPGLRDDIEKLQDILKNNQIVIQYRAAHEDLMKTMSEGQRVLKENIAIERNRTNMIVQTSGYLKGFAEDFGDITTGVQKFAELSAQQRLAFGERGAAPENRSFTGLRQSFREDTITRNSLVAQMNELDKTLIAIREISDVSTGFGAVISPEDLDKYTEEIIKTGDRGTGLLLNETKYITSNTAQTVDRLDQLLEQGGDESALERLINRIPGGFLGPEMIVKRLEVLSERRDKALAKGNTDIVANFDRAMDALVTKLIGEVGVEKSLSMVQQSKQLFGEKDFTSAEFIQRALGNINFSGFAKSMEQVQPGITKTKEFTDLVKLQGDQRDTQIVSNKTINQLLAAYSTFEHFNKVASNKQITQLDEQINQLKSRRKEAKDEGDVKDLTEQIEGLTRTRGDVAGKARGQATRELIAPIAIASQELAKSLGMTDRQMRVLGGTVASTYAAWKLWEKLTGEPVPEYLEELGKKSEEAVKRMTESGFTGKAWQAWYGAKDLVFGKGLDEDLRRAEETIKKERIFTDEEVKKAQEKIILGGEKAEESEVTYRGKSSLREKIDAAVKEMQRKKAERGSTTEEEILGENENQTGILHGIFEKVRDTADNTQSFTEALHGEMKKDRHERQGETKSVVENVDKLRSEYLEKQGIVSDPFKKVIGALIAATATGYLGEKRGDVGRFNELGNRAESQVELINKIIAEYPDVVSKAIEEFRSKIETASVERVAPETELIHRAVKVSDFEEEVVNRLQNVRERMAEEYDKVNDSMEEASDRIARLEMAEQFEMQMEQIEDAMEASRLAEVFEDKVLGQIGGVLSGASLPKTTLAERDIFNIPALARVKAAERSGSSYRRGMTRIDRELDKIIVKPFREAGKEVVALFHGLTLGVFSKDIGDIADEFEKIGAERDVLINQAREMQQELSGLSGKDLTKMERERYKMLANSFGDVQDKVQDLNSSLQQMAVQLEKAEVIEQARIERLQAYAQISAQAAAAGAEFGVAGGRGMARGLRGFTAVPSLEAGPRFARQMTPEQRAYFENTKVGPGC
jgi:Mg2+ and Co2+ transporter CorA